jgi:hypothetical protein
MYKAQSRNMQYAAFRPSQTVHTPTNYRRVKTYRGKPDPGVLEAAANKYLVRRERLRTHGRRVLYAENHR